jgi:hypothetical protein
MGIEFVAPAKGELRREIRIECGASAAHSTAAPVFRGTRIEQNLPRVSTMKSRISVISSLSVAVAAAVVSLSGCWDDTIAQQPVFTLTSPDLAGDVCGAIHAQRVWLLGAEHIARAAMERHTTRNQVACSATLRSGCAVGQRILALGGLRYPADRHGATSGCGNNPAMLPAGLRRQHRLFDTGATGVKQLAACPPQGDPPHRYTFTLFAWRRQGGSRRRHPKDRHGRTLASC